MRICELEGTRVALWGAGREGASAYRALSALATPPELTVVSDATASDEQRRAFTGGAQVRLLAGGDGLAALRDSEVVIRSPGISRYRPEVPELETAGVKLTTGTNLWMAEHLEDPVLAVTGTKGKSTTSALIAHLARHQGTKVLLAGNMGSPLLDHLAPVPTPDLWVLELSSYQTADLEYSPRAAIVLNLHPEHLDWHGSHERYFADKLNLLHDRGRVLASLNARDARLKAIEAPTHTRWFGAPAGYDAEGPLVKLGGTTVLDGAHSPLVGEHNALNICAALTGLATIGLAVPDPALALRGFQPLPHRLQPLATPGSLRFVNDSISTTPESTLAALAALTDGHTPLVLIAGGYDRGQHYEQLARAILQAGVRAVVGLPDTGTRLLETIRGQREQSGETAGAAATELLAAPDIDAAVRAARESLGAKGVVLLSPAAPSYGAFRNFEERGERFAQAVARESANLTP